MGIGNVRPHPDASSCYPLPNLLPPSAKMPPLKISEIEAAKRVAMAYGPQFVVPITVALLSHTHQSWQRPESELAKKEVEAIANVLREGDTALVEDYSQVAAVMKDVVYTLQYERYQAADRSFAPVERVYKWKRRQE